MAKSTANIVLPKGGKMANQKSPHSYTSADFEKAALRKFCNLLPFLPNECKVFREIGGNSTVLCIDCEYCPDFVEQIQQQSFPILLTAHSLGLADSVVFRLGKRVIGWTNMNTLS
jgi:hypothetical protein